MPHQSTPHIIKPIVTSKPVFIIRRHTYMTHAPWILNYRALLRIFAVSNKFYKKITTYWGMA